MNASNIELLAKLLGAKKIRKSSQYVMFNCPFAKWTHHGGDDYKPSFGVSISSESVYHCFACGVKGRLRNLPMNLSLFTNRVERDIQEFINSCEPDYSISDIERNVTINFTAIREKFNSLRTLGKNRWFTKRDIELWDIRYDKDKDAIVFPIYNKEGNLIALKGRKMDSKQFFFYNNSANVKQLGVWYGEHITRATIKKVVLCEGERDAIYLSRYGLTSWACMGSVTKQQIDALKKENKEFVLFFDNDSVGEQITMEIIKKCSIFVKLYVISDYSGFKDPAEVVENNKLIEVLSSAKCSTKHLTKTP